MAPRPHAGVIERRGLLTRLDAGLAKRLTLVCGPTGFGKTTLVSTWIARGHFPSAWVTLDENDNDPIRFWTYLVSAVRTIDPNIGKATLSALMSPQPKPFESLLTPFLNDLARLQENSALVLEDYHAITSGEIHEGLSFLIQHLPDSLHMILITRMSPDLPVAILRARGELVEIDAAGLRLNVDETAAFLQESLHVDLLPEAVRQIYQRTEGWAAGLRLAALSLQNKGAGSNIGNLVQTFSGNDRYIADYLIREVFDTQPPEIQSFLLNTCFFSRLTGSLCDAMTGGHDGKLLLERLARDDLFIVELEHGRNQTWYRYSALFAESLQFLARQRLTEADIGTLFERASDWYESNGLFEEAIETALSARLFTRALALIEKYIERHDLGEMRTLARWLDNIPSEIILQRPILCFTYAQIILYTGDRFAPATAARLEPLLHAAEAAWRAEGNDQRLGQLLSFRGTVTMWQGDFQKAFQYARESLEIIPEQDVLYRGSSLLIAGREALNAGRVMAAQDMILEARAQTGAAQNIHGVLASIQVLSELAYWQGELEQAEQLNKQVLEGAIGGEEMVDDRGMASLGLANVAYEQNDLERAGQLALEALDLGNRRGNEMLQLEATLRLAGIRAAHHDLRGAIELLATLAGKITNPMFLRQLQTERTRLLILAGDLLSLTGWTRMITNEGPNISSLQKERDAFTLARLQMAEGEPAEALKTLHGYSQDAAQNGRLRSQAEALILEALAWHLQSDASNATRLLRKALTLGHAKGFCRLFLDEGAHLEVLLQAVASTISDRSLRLYASALLHSLSPDRAGGQGVPGAVEPLSPQELRVLRLLAAGLSNAEIARELVVSTNTIKTQVKSIFRKLNITSRAEARDMARELKLI
jgi:LuxR family maltose regulon positive regulatory protein